MSAPGRKPPRAGYICHPPAACSENNTLCFFHRQVFLLSAEEAENYDKELKNLIDQRETLEMDMLRLKATPESVIHNSLLIL